MTQILVIAGAVAIIAYVLTLRARHLALTDRRNDFVRKAYTPENYTFRDLLEGVPDHVEVIAALYKYAHRKETTLIEHGIEHKHVTQIKNRGSEEEARLASLSTRKMA